MKKNRIGLRVFLCVLSFAVCFSGFLVLLSSRNTMLPSAIAEEMETAEAMTLNYSDGSVYDGDTLYGRVRNGTGTFKWNTGESYSGRWENDTMTLTMLEEPFLLVPVWLDMLLSMAA